MYLLNKFRNRVENRRRRKWLEGVYERYRGFTMIPPRVYMENLSLIERVRPIPGCVVECGVWRGGMSAGIATLLGPERTYFLFDSFEGLPPAQSVDGEAALRWQENTQSSTYYDNCSASPEYAQQAMTLSGASNFHLAKGWFNETLPGFTPSEPIALLRLDVDWYESTMVCLQSLFEHVSPGGMIILDDYYTWDGCSRALHDFLSQQSSTERISSHSGICYIQKRQDEHSSSSPKK